MKRTMKYLLLLLAAPCWAGILSVQLNPSDGALTATPGDAVVWGVQAINTDVSDYLLITSVEAPEYAGTGAPGEIPDGANAFTDYLSVYFLNNFTSQGLALAPGQVLDVGYSSGVPTVGDPNTTGFGLASEAISPDATTGLLNATIEVHYDVYDGDPFATGNYVYSSETDVSTSVAVGLVSGPSSAPEPSAWIAILLALSMLGLYSRRFQNARRVRCN